MRDFLASQITSGGTLTSYGAPKFMEIGTGSSTVSTADTTLLTPFDRNAFAAAPSVSTPKRVTYEATWNVTEVVNGTVIKEIGLSAISGLNTGSLFNRIVIPNESFDGTKELLVDIDVTLS